MILSDTVYFFLRGQERLRRQWEASEIRKLALLAGFSWETGEEMIEAGVSPAQACELFLDALRRPIA